ncbi:MAG: DNA mismatch repair protein MutS [Candidatus Eisenbacteria bacterium]|nr:DNA mismatch repair protein MutS [Candidatus Eisenbacteria bacterium]
MEARTPMMRQYWAMKERHPEAILFFRMGDFYEMFHEDAETASRVLGLTLTSRSKGEESPIPLAGVPWHKADHYVDRLLRAGFKVAICDQTEDPKKAKGLVRREVTEVVTPGTALGGALLEGNRPNYLMALAPGRSGKEERVGVAAMDVTTGDFRIGELPPEEVEEEVARFEPAEVLVPDGEEARFAGLGRNGRAPMISRVEEWRFDGDQGERTLRDHFGVETLDGFGCSGLPLGLAAAAVLFGYLRDLGRDNLHHVDRVRGIGARTHMILDETTRRNLEIFRPIREGTEGATLLAIVDGSVTSMGGRLLREWLMRPLIDPEAIGARLGAVEEGVERSVWREEARALLRRFGDLERLAGKIVLGRGTPRDLAALRETLRRVPALADLFREAASPLLREIAERLEPMEELVERIARAIVDEPPATIQEGGIIREGYDAELDELRRVGTHGQNWMVELQEAERKRTGIPSLKVGFNKVFGYYIEVSKARAENVPPTYIRKQTLVNAERYITPELKEQEDRILGAEERIRALEERLFLEIRSVAAAEGTRIRRIGGAAAELDVLLGFADAAVRRRYVRPRVGGGTALRIRKGRHPVVEALLGPGEFIPNDTELDTESEQIHILTGPNMAGKSTYLRQVALIQILAQTGCFVPAEEADLGVADRVFTRVGASDDLARGQSTFLVEMTETANILHNATERSLVLLDEIGRGTSTFDGVSIAWAVVEYLHAHAETAAKTLFATHYHELAELAERLERVRNYSVLVKEWRDRVVFLRRVVPGSVDRSYGIQVARLAGLPDEVIRRAKEVLAGLEREHAVSPSSRSGRENDAFQLNLFSSEEERVLEEIRDLDPERTTPLESLRKIQEWGERLKREREA